MVSNFLVFVKYPSVSGILAIIWIGSTFLIATNPELPITKMLVINTIASVIIAIVGFRVDKA